MKPKPIPINRVREVFSYREGDLLKGGDKAGWLCNGRYLMVDLDYQKYLVHRVVWALFNDDVPDVLDHINQDKLDNRIENLRPSNKSLNNFNVGLGRNNTSGCRGVNKHPDANTWQVRHRGKYLCSFKTYEEAVEFKTNLVERENICH